MKKTTTPNSKPKMNREDFYKKIVKNPLATVSTEFVATLILILVLFGIAIRPTIVTIKSLQLKIDEFTAFNSKLEKKLTTLEKLSPQIINQKYKVELLKRAIPDKPEFPQFEKQLRYLVQKNNLSLVTLSFTDFPLIENQVAETQNLDKDEKKESPKSDEENVVKNEDFIEYSLSVTGSYTNVKNFLSQLQNLIRISQILNITIDKPTSATYENDLSLKLTARIYYKNL